MRACLAHVGESCETSLLSGWVSGNRYVLILSTVATLCHAYLGQQVADVISGLAKLERLVAQGSSFSIDRGLQKPFLSCNYTMGMASMA